METNLPPSLPPEKHTGSGIMGELRQLIASISFHLLTLFKLAQIEAVEIKKRLFLKFFLLGISLFFFISAFFTANAAAVFYLNEFLDNWQLSLLAVTGGNLIIGAIFIIIATSLSLPFFKDTITELENDLVWITEKYKAKK